MGTGVGERHQLSSLKNSDEIVRFSLDIRTISSDTLFINNGDGGMNSDQFGRWLKKQGVEITSKKSGGGHRALHNPANGKISELPTHGGSKQLRTSTMEKIKKELGLD